MKPGVAKKGASPPSVPVVVHASGHADAGVLVKTENIVHNFHTVLGIALGANSDIAITSLACMDDTTGLAAPLHKAGDAGSC